MSQLRSIELNDLKDFDYDLEEAVGKKDENLKNFPELLSRSGKKIDPFTSVLKSDTNKIHQSSNRSRCFQKGF